MNEIERQVLYRLVHLKTMMPAYYYGLFILLIIWAIVIALKLPECSNVDKDIRITRNILLLNTKSYLANPMRIFIDKIWFVVCLTPIIISYIEPNFWWFAVSCIPGYFFGRFIFDEISGGIVWKTENDGKAELALINKNRARAKAKEKNN